MFIRIISIKKKLIGILFISIILMTITVVYLMSLNKSPMMMGAFIHMNEESSPENRVPGYDSDRSYALGERFERPSKLPALKLKYDFIRPKEDDEVPPYIPDGFPEKYESAEDVVQAYYAILRNASNMIGYQAGCGTIVWMDRPYPYAYRLLTEDVKEGITLEEFKNSFKGTGAITLLHLTPAYQPPNTSEYIKYFFVEVEVLKGHPYNKGENSKRQPNFFEYYYGIVTTEYDEKDGWRIKSVDYSPEVYLCHPLHGWDYEHKFFLGVVYNNWYEMDLTIDYEEMDNNYIQVYASNEDNEYKFDFVRLTNGDDILLHEYMKEDDQWKEVSILKPRDEKYYKISILKYNESD